MHSEYLCRNESGETITTTKATNISIASRFLPAEGCHTGPMMLHGAC